MDWRCQEAVSEPLCSGMRVGTPLHFIESLSIAVLLCIYVGGA